MAYNKVIYDGRTLIDLTDLDVTASDVKSGITFILADGTKAVGTLVSTSTPTANTIAEWDSSVHMNSEDMTAQEVQDFVDSLNITSINAVDYIVEQGTSGIWTYRKWNSGVAECWGSINVTITSWIKWGEVYYSNPYNNYANYPSGLFAEIPILTATPNGTAVDTWLISNTAGDSSRTDAYYFGRGATSGTSVKRINFHAIGKWK